MNTPFSVRPRDTGSCQPMLPFMPMPRKRHAYAGNKPLEPAQSPFQASPDGPWSEGRTMIDTCTDVHLSRCSSPRVPAISGHRDRWAGAPRAHVTTGLSSTRKRSHGELPLMKHTCFFCNNNTKKNVFLSGSTGLKSSCMIMMDRPNGESGKEGGIQISALTQYTIHWCTAHRAE